MAQMKAYTIPMKNWTQICLTIVFCRHKQVQPDVTSDQKDKYQCEHEW